MRNKASLLRPLNLLLVSLLSLAWATALAEKVPRPSTAQPQALWQHQPGIESRSSGPLSLSGNFRQGGLLLGVVEPGYEVLFRDKPLVLAAGGYFIVGLDRDAPATLELAARARDGASKKYVFAISKQQYDIQYIEGVARKYVSPDPKQVERSRREARLVVAARAGVDSRDAFLQGFDWPAEGPVTGVFGSQRVYNGEPRRPHYGLDIAGPVGTPIKAPAPGIVTLAEPDLFFSGGTLVIDHGLGLSSTFLHLSKLLVEEGQSVGRGELVAEMGATGRVTGSHLDWRMNWVASGHSVRLDPRQLLPAAPESTQ